MVSKKVTKMFENKNVKTWIIVIAIFVLIGFILSYFMNAKSKNTRNVEMEAFQEKPTLSLVYAYSNTCPHCTKFHNTFEIKSKEFASLIEDMNVEISKFEKTNLPEKYSKYIDGFPTVMIFKDGVFLKKTVGNIGAEDFLNSLKSSIKS